ncbi:TonB-dependent receptor domain-containing protein [Gilvimarinus sp. F26214L]|uniref:TonB-dependent receptor domain-containing protein n=1 Tax=Gilvimarinus sp. DZF01 TaxID=3461371 RepID=UPI0040453986
MLKSVPVKRKPIAFAVMLAAYGLSAAAQENGVIEEILVTGSYIKGSPTDAPSPVTSIDRTSIESQGAAVVWDVIKNLEVNSGSITNPGSGDAAQTAGTASINLRNLGENSTLTLVNGRRQVSAAANTVTGGEFVDINAIPLVMTDRVEVLTDGGSALYGSDAVAGVVNIIMRTDFEGVEVYGDIQGITEADDAYDKTASVIWGWGSDSGDTHLVLSAERFERDPVSVRDASFFDKAEFTGQVGGAPTEIGTLTGLVPVYEGLGPQNFNQAYINQDVMRQNDLEDDGVLNGSANLVFTDPLCDDVTSADGSSLFVGTRSDDRGLRTGACREDTSEWQYIAYGMERSSFAGSFSHAFSPRAEFYSFFQYSESETERADSGSNEARGPTLFLAPAGSTPFSGMGLSNWSPELGGHAAMAGGTPPTAADQTNNPHTLANGGLNAMFWAPVRSGTPRTGGDDNVTRTSTAGVQLGLRGDFDLAGKVYDFDVGYSWSGSSLEQDYRTFQRDRAELAANGLGGPDCTPNGVTDYDFTAQGGPLWAIAGPQFTQTFFPGFVFSTRESISLALTSTNHGQDGCMFYNPYLTAVKNAELANSPELMEWMNPVIRRTDKRNKLGVFDAVVSGEMFEMAGGTAQFALGAQYRQQTNASIANRLNQPGLPNAILGYDASGNPNEYHYVSNNFECSMCSFDYDHDRNVKSTFLEFSLPFADSVESQLALRWEDYGGNIGSDVTSKFAISWRPADSLLLRSSYSQSFRAPNVAIVYEGLEAGSTTFRDPLRNQAVRAGLADPTNENAMANFTYTVGAPAPDVGNETADTYNVGFIWTPAGALDGFSLQADLWRFDVEDRVLPQPPISAIQDEIAAFNVAKQDPNNYVLNDQLPDLIYQSCDPNALAATYGQESDERLNCVVDPRAYQAEGVVRAAGSDRAALTTIYLSSINAGTIQSDGVDFKMGYTWDNDWGLFNVGLNFTHVRKYELNDVPGLELGLMETGVFDAAGTTGDGLLVRSLPDNKGHVSFNWMYDNHGVSLTNRYIGSYEDLAYDSLYERSNDEVRALLDRKIDSYNTWDMQYSYRHAWSNQDYGTATFTVGLLDAFNADIPYRETGSLNYDATVFDGRGRRAYLRMLLQF